MRRQQKSTIIDVAKLAKVSRATVTRALDKYRQTSITPETRERVLAAVAELRYRPSLMAKQLKAGKTQAVCLTFVGSPDEGENMIGAGPITLQYNDAIHGTQLILKRIGYRLETFHAESREEAQQALPEMFLAGYFDAAFFPHAELNATAHELARDGCIVLGGAPPLKGISNLIHVPSTSWDTMPMVDEAIRQGRTHLLFTYPISQAIEEKYAEKLRSGELQFESFERGDRSMLHYVGAIVEIVLSKPIDAVITADEFFGWEVFKGLHRCGIEVPDRVTITGAADVRHVFKPLPILQLEYAPKAQQMRNMACRFAQYLAAEERLTNFVLPPPLQPFRRRVQTLTREQFLTASRADLCREHLQREVELEILRAPGKP